MNQGLAQTLLNAAQNRHSVRIYLPDALPAEVLSEIDNFMETLDVPFSHSIEIRRFFAEPGKKLYNNGVNPPNNLAIIAPTDLVSISKAGFCGQLVMLKLTAMGVNTCWFGHYKLQELAKYIGDEFAAPSRIKETTFRLGYGYGNPADDGVRAVCCIACGRADRSAKSLIDKVAKKNGIGRKPLVNLMESGADLTLLSSSVVEALDAARLAPSAANSQMWRFGIRDNGKTVTVAKPIGYKHFKWEHPDVDIGICAAHLWLGLVNCGFNPVVELKQDADRAMWLFHL